MKKLFIALFMMTALLCVALTACGKENENNGGGNDTPVTYTVTIAVNNTKYGSVNKTSVTARYGSAISVSGNELTIGDEVVIATPALEDEAFTYTFGGFTGVIKTLTRDIVITAEFVAEEKIPDTFKVTFIVEGNNYCEPVFVVIGSKLIAPSKDPEKQVDSLHEYAFDGWYNGETKWDFDNDIVTEDTVLTAKFRVTATYTEPFLPSAN